MAIAGLSTIDGTLAAFDDHLRRVRGVSSEVRRGYARIARRFLDGVFGDGPVCDLGRLSASDVVGFVFNAQGRYRPSTLQGVTTALRSFLRFLAVEGACVDRLEEAVPKVALRRLSSVPRHLSCGEFERLIASLYERDSPDGLRARAMLLLAARLGLRAGEIARLALDDIDWRSGTVRIRTRKTGHGALLPLPVDVGEAIVGYLQRGRPASDDRHVFLLHQQRVGAPIDRRVVGDVARRAVARTGIQAPVRGANLLRHSLASGLLANGASLKEIADLFGHRALSSTQVYAKVNVVALREAALPWPEVTR
jgi:site-specific recombinase XerD